MGLDNKKITVNGPLCFENDSIYRPTSRIRLPNYSSTYKSVIVKSRFVMTGIL